MIQISCGVKGSNTDSDTQTNTDVKFLEKKTRELMRYLYKKDTKEIVQYISKEGIIDGDTYIPAEDYISMILDVESHSSKVLYKRTSDAELRECEKSGDIIFISPWQYYKYFGEEYSITIKEYNGTGVYNVKFESKIINGCTIRLWPTEMTKINNDYFAYGLLFE